jgi:hypothetical protein
MYFRLPSVDPQRLAVLLLVAASVAVCALASVSLTSADPESVKVFDRLHWTVSYVTAPLIAWLGMWQIEGPDRTARRWFATGLTITAIAYLDYVYWDSPATRWCRSTAINCSSP